MKKFLSLSRATKAKLCTIFIDEWNHFDTLDCSTHTTAGCVGERNIAKNKK
jgi:hypothetical protein